MKILVFGATGRTGASVLEQALAAGHDVTAFVRNTAKFAASSAAVAASGAVAEGDIYQPETVVAAMQGGGFDAVVNTVGVSPFEASTVVTDGARAIVDAMTQAGITRYLGITGTAQMPKSAGGTVAAAIIRRSPIRHAVRDHDGAYAIVKESTLDWTLAGCPYIKDGPRTEKYTLASRFPGGFKTISPGDVADFFVKELAAHAYSREIVGIWY